MTTSFGCQAAFATETTTRRTTSLKTETPKATSHQVFIAHGGNSLVDEQYLFEEVKDARWFWKQGYKTRLYLDNENNPIPYDRMTLGIDGREVATR